MKKLASLVIITLLSLSSSAQENGLSIGFGGSYDNHLNEYNENPWPGFDHELSDIIEFSFGTQINFQINDKVGLRSGISYSRKGYKIIYAWIAIDGGDGTGDPAVPLESEFRLNYLDLPLGIYYQVISTARYNLSPSIGIMNSINIGESEISEMGDGAMKETTFNSFDTSPYLFGARLGLINNLNLNERMFISLEPYITYNLSKINDTVIEKSELAYGGYVSINFRINNK